jgi:hypothetical protein
VARAGIRGNACRGATDQAGAYLRDAGHVRRIVAALDRIAANGL